jgi:hypothetical protein
MEAALQKFKVFIGALAAGRAFSRKIGSTKNRQRMFILAPGDLPGAPPGFTVCLRKKGKNLAPVYPAAIIMMVKSGEVKPGGGKL